VGRNEVKVALVGSNVDGVIARGDISSKLQDEYNGESLDRYVQKEQVRKQ
jgi:hypothetical protein